MADDDAGFTIVEPGDEPPEPKDGGKKDKRPRRRDILATTLSGCHLWRSPDGIAHVSVKLHDGRREHMRCESKSFREWLTCSYLRLTGSGISGTALAECV